MLFKVDSEIFNKVDDYCVGIIVACGLCQPADMGVLTDYKQSVIEKARTQLADADIKTTPKIAKYRAAMNALGVNANKYQTSVESLLRRVQSGDIIESIAPAVDLGNAVSVKYGFPVGVHNIDSFSGDMEVRFSGDNDIFDESKNPREPVYVTGNSVRTRNWLWRQTEAGRMTTAGAENILFLIDGFEENAEDIISARNELSLLLTTHFGCEVRVGFVSSKNPSFKIAGLTETEKTAEDD